MKFTQAEIQALIESSQFIRKLCFDPLDPQSAELCQEIDAFIARLRASSQPNLTPDEVRNSVIFLSNYIDSQEDTSRLKAHRVLLFRLTEILRAQEE